MRFNGTSQNTVANAPYSSSVNTLVSVKVRDRNRLNGTIGAATLLSTTTNVIRAMTPTASMVSISAGFASGRGHSIRAKTTAPNPSTPSTAPAQSIEAVRDSSWLSPTKRTDAAITSAAIGTFSKNAARQV